MTTARAGPIAAMSAKNTRNAKAVQIVANASTLAIAPPLRRSGGSVRAKGR